MKIFKKYILAAIFLGSIFNGLAFSQVRVFAQVDSQQDIYVGQSFAYHIIIDGDNQPGQVDLAPLADFSPQSAGNRDVSQTSISIINGQTSKSEVKRFVMSYALVSNRLGTIQINPVDVTVAGKTYKTNTVTVNILQPDTTDKLFLEVSLSEEKCYVGQPVVMTVKFYRFGNIGSYQFDIPVLSSDSFYVEDTDDAANQVKPYRTTKDGREAILYTFNKVLIPKNSGKIDIAPASISAELVVGQSRSDDFFDSFFQQNQYKRFMVKSNSLSLDVLPLPEQDKPESFYGLVGRYSIEASASPTTDVYMGDPITLTIKIGGGKYLKPVQWPDLQSIPELAANFKMPDQKASPTMEGDYKVFIQTIRPDNNKANVIPAIPLAYFDPDKGCYNVINTQPIKLDLKPSKRLTASDIEGKDFATVNKEIEAIKNGLSANYESPDVLENMSFSMSTALLNPFYLMISALPLSIFIVSLVIKTSTNVSPQKIAAKRRKLAGSKAIAQLKKLIAVQSSNRSELVVSAMKQYIADRFDKLAGSLTPGDCYEMIMAAAKDNELADKYRQILEHCQVSRFAPIEVHIDGEKTKEIIELIRHIEKKSQK